MQSDNQDKCQYCGEDTSNELKSELIKSDHWDCILENVEEIKNEKQS